MLLRQSSANSLDRPDEEGRPVSYLTLPFPRISPALNLIKDSGLSLCYVKSVAIRGKDNASFPWNNGVDMS